MNIKFLGTWSSNLVRGKRNVSFLLDDKIAFDFGPHSLESLLDRKINPNNVKTVLITHMHLDHYAGIAELLWYRSVYRAKSRLLILGPRGIRSNTARLLKNLKTPEAWYSETIETKTDYLENKDFDFIKIYRANHLIPCNAYRVEYGGKTLFYSGDTAYSRNVVKGARGVEYLIHEMTYTDKDRKLADMWRHSTYSDAIRVFNESGAKHLIPVHFTPSSEALVSRKIGKVKGIVYPADTITL